MSGDTIAVEATELRVGDVVDGAGMVTAASLHPSGWVVVELDWQVRRRWRRDALVAIAARDTPSR